MKKKLLIATVIVSAALIMMSIFSIPNQKIAKNLDPKNTSSNEWKEINTYSKTPEELVITSRASAFFKAAHSNLPDIYTCLKKDFCGMVRSGPNDTYFDDKKTPAHILINRILKIIKESLKRDATF